MPHQCTECGNRFPDGSKEMLSGCPDCGGTKFQFHPEGAADDTPDQQSDPPEQADSADPPDPPERSDSSIAESVGKAASTVRDLMGGDNAPSPRTADDAEDTADAETNAEADANTESEPASAAAEDVAQASARSDVVSPDELPDPPETERPEPAGPPDPGDGTVVSTPSDEKPDLADLREELNDQFESIRIVEPGQYELNLMELYDRDEYIIALQENGKYSIQVPETWLGDDE